MTAAVLEAAGGYGGPVAGGSEPPLGAPAWALGEWLAARRGLLDGWEGMWLGALARFDLEQGWAIDGHLSCVDWLMWRAGMARATAFEKVRVAHELRRRPLVAAALEDGRASYSAVRLILRAEGACAEVDEALLAVAEAGTVADVARAVRTYWCYADQERAPADPGRRRGLRLVPQGDGTTRVEAVLTDMEAAELDAALERAMAVGSPAPVDESARADSPPVGEPPATWPERRADALVELARTVPGRYAAGGDRYRVHLVIADGGVSLLGGDPVDWPTAEQVRCDCATVVHHHRNGAPLALGRLTRTWSTAQRRAITVRDGGRCRWPGCERTHVDVHHLLPWEHGGPTDIANGVLVCPRHHTMLHRGWTTTGSADGHLTFHRP